ncbi:MAG: hypothetical protein AAGK97_02910 [Bacteroidota bacterium]
MKWKYVFIIFFFPVFLLCSSDQEIVEHGDPLEEAQVLSVTFIESNGSYNFSVEIQSPDEGCEQYANWWEIVSSDGKLLYRRILGHSHVNEQPFIRSGGPVELDPNQKVFIRGHMNNSGYGTKAYTGTVANGFQAVDLERNFASDLAQQEPLPGACPF